MFITKILKIHTKLYRMCCVHVTDVCLTHAKFFLFGEFCENVLNVASSPPQYSKMVNHLTFNRQFNECFALEFAAIPFKAGWKFSN